MTRLVDVAPPDVIEHSMKIIRTLRPHDVGKNLAALGIVVAYVMDEYAEDKEESLRAFTRLIEVIVRRGSNEKTTQH